MISVIIPTYNNEKYIKRSVNSLINQTYKDIEIIIVNDGSTDKTEEICKNLMKEHKNIQYIYQKNGGAAKARNTGLKMAKGQYIGFLDADDWADDDMYEMLYNMMKQHGAQISEVGGRTICNGHSIKNVKIETIECNRDKALEYHLNSRGKFFGCSVCNKLFARYIVEEIKFEEGRIAEDILFVVQAILKSNILVSSTISKHNYDKTNEMSVTSRPSDMKYNDIMYVLKKRISLLKSTNNKNLVESSKTKYYLEQLVYYCYCKGNSKIEKNIKRTIRDNFFELLCYKMSIRDKISFILFFISPKIFYSIFRLYKGIKINENV